MSASSHRRFLFILGVLAVVAHTTAQAAAPEDELDDGRPFAEDEEDSAPHEDFLENSPQWKEFTGRMQRSIDAAGLLRARRWGNIANGALLAATGPVAFVVSIFGLKLSNVVLSLYITAFGGGLAGLELGLKPVAPWISENLSYLATSKGRTAVLAFMGGLTWPLGRLGLVPALLTALNAVFNANFAKLLAFVSEDDSPSSTETPIVDEPPVSAPPPSSTQAEMDAAEEAQAAAAAARAAQARMAQPEQAAPQTDIEADGAGTDDDETLAAVREALKQARANAAAEPEE